MKRRLRPTLARPRLARRRLARRLSQIGCKIERALGLLLAACFIAGCGAPQPNQPNVLLISVDTLRADYIGAYHSDKTRTPHIDRLAREGVLFENAMAPIPLTRPSHFSLLSSVYPRDHGVVNNKFSLPEDITTLTQVLQAAGYQTAGFTGTTLLSPASGVSRGFDVFEFPEDLTRSAGAVIEGATSWLLARSSERPFFLWVHLFDPHMPYAPPPAWRPDSPASPGDPDGPTGVAERLPSLSWSDLSSLASQMGGDLPRAVYERALRLYAGEVEYVDSSIGLLLAALEARDLLDDTVVVFTADHGECFKNGVFFLHANCIFEPAVRIPLIIRYPTVFSAGVRRSDVVEILDIATTLLAVAGLGRPAAFRGGDLRYPRPAAAQRAFIQHPMYPGDVVERSRQKGKLLDRVMGEKVRPLIVNVSQEAVRAPDWKFVRTGENEELFHLATDPGERTNRIHLESEVAARLSTLG